MLIIIRVYINKKIYNSNVPLYKFFNFAIGLLPYKIEKYFIYKKNLKIMYMKNKYTKFKPDIKMTDLLQYYCALKDIYSCTQEVSSTYKF